MLILKRDKPLAHVRANENKLDFFKFCRRFWKAVLIKYQPKFCSKNRSMVITEEFCTLFLKLFALGIFLRGFTVSSYQRPLY